MMRAQISDPMPKERIIFMMQCKVHSNVLMILMKLTALRPSLFDGHKMMSLLDRLENCLGVKWTQRSQVDDFSFNSFSGELVGSLESIVDGFRMSDEGDVLAGSHDLCFSNWQCEVLV